MPIECEQLRKMPDAMQECRRRGCDGEMQPGAAIRQTYTGSPDFPGGHVVTMSPGGPGQLVPCLKCKKCGYSMEQSND